MPGENSSHNSKVDTWMPLDIGRFLQDTMHLSSTQIGNYILLLMHYWTHGAIQNDSESLARIARENPDAWSIAQAKLSMFFSIGEDGLLHQAGADRRMSEWKAKRQKAKEKASKAARARWNKYRANKEGISDAPSITQAMPEQCPSPEVQEQKQIQPPPTPPAGAAGDDSLGDAPSMAASMEQAAPNGVLEASQMAQESENKAKPSKMAAVARPDGREDVSGRGQGETSGAGRRMPAAKGFNLRSEPRKTDPREDWIKSEVLAYWAHQNPDGPELHFTPADDRAFSSLLKDHPELSQPLFKKLLRHRAKSEVNPSALPHKWIRNIFEYAAGELGKFGKPLSRSRVI